ncbi:hypothetical protein D9619_004557 [Psilocybe cf. subviscida]|uniref:Telomerase reverse transcriptase n=1 Tax=Psilocybe cf. subviscida TaxID=2480587 RepID=A0A8H5BSJ4_9AGAR|nr:hypothetical protein D9619_004557 [Psilocybe cf. subviscida]
MSNLQVAQVASSILKKFYPSVTILQDYLQELLETTNGRTHNLLGHILLREDDSESYKCLLSTSFVARKSHQHRTIKLYASMLDMREVIDEAQHRLLKIKGSQNVITSGYRLASRPGDQGRNGMTRLGVTNYFINTVITAFQAPEWTTLLERIGEGALLHLLTETSIFVGLPNGCLCQLSGEPVIYVVPMSVQREADAPSPRDSKRRTATFEDIDMRPTKRQKGNTGAQIPIQDALLPSLSQSSPADINFARVRLFYSKPNYISSSSRILVGLPLRHVLNRLVPCYETKGLPAKYTGQGSDKLAADARHLSKYIFARQYGLNTPFSSTVKGPSSINDCLDRELEIQTMGRCKTPKRLKDILPLCEKILLHHAKCAYIPLRDITCRSKVKSQARDLDSTVILEMMSEHSAQIRSQVSMGALNVSCDSSGGLIPPAGLTQAKKHAQAKPRFTEFACNHVEVYRYVVLITNALIPKSMWGSKANFKLMMKYVKEFISCRRHETLSLHYILQGFSISDCDWLIPPGPCAKKQTRVSVTDSLKRRELLEDFLLWYFDSFLVPLLRAKSSAFRNQILYFRHDDWETLCAPLIERLTSVTFAKLPDDEAGEILRQRRLGFSFVRLLPKETGVRPIVNLRRKKGIKRGSFTTQQSINQILQAAFAILTYERTNQRDLVGASAFSRDDIYFKLKKLKNVLPRGPKGELPKLYFVKVDVQACFDTIDQGKLLHILRRLLSEDVYMMQKYGQVTEASDKVKRNYVKKAVPEDEHPHFLRHAADLANILRNTIFVDQVVYPLSKKEEILALLEEHITENIVKIGTDYFRQVVGIPQGSVLSSILCSFFYGDLEKRFGKFMHDPLSTLLRVVDDYLFISTDRKLAKEFLDMMSRGHPEYGCFISSDKSLTNFDYEDQLMNTVPPGEQTFPWCGYSINTRDLSITVDYTRYFACGVRSTLTVGKGRNPGKVFAYKLLQLAKAKSHAIFSDRTLNSDHVVYTNIFQNLLLTAMKMHEYICDWGAHRRLNEPFLRSVIEKVIMLNYTTVLGQIRRQMAQIKADDTHIQKKAVTWLGYRAFYLVLSRKGNLYSPIVKWLCLEQKRGKYRLYQRRYQTLVKDAQVVFAQIPA